MSDFKDYIPEGEDPGALGSGFVDFVPGPKPQPVVQPVVKEEVAEEQPEEVEVKKPKTK